ncbi:MAG: LemA family protein [Gemmatimonadota bacterium]|nr:MAG: LemA family protein [Gemmatimonadota bacterium]
MPLGSLSRDPEVPLGMPAVRRPRLLAALLATALLSGCGYSRIQELDERAAEARSDIEVQLLRRSEVVPSLVETVERYAEVESSVIEAVADSRVGLVAAVRSADLSAMQSASGALSRALGDLLAAVADYADLQADPGFQRLRSQLEDTRDQIVRAARSYNEAVGSYNEFIAAFPQAVTARVIGAERRQPFGSSEETDSASVDPADE